MMKISFSEEELNHILQAWAAISFSFAILLSRSNFSAFPGNLLISGLTVGLAFLIHEISHKITAQFYGCWAEFRKFDLGLILAVFMSFFGFIFAAPGAVMIMGLVSSRENGKIALAGPLSNIIFAIFFFGIIFFFKGVPDFLMKIFSFGFGINSWLAFFNLIPFFPLDGSKIISWSFPIWLILFLFSGFLAFFLY